MTEKQFDAICVADKLMVAAGMRNYLAYERKALADDIIAVDDEINLDEQDLDGAATELMRRVGGNKNLRSYIACLVTKERS
jgi:hypothetical protein